MATGVDPTRTECSGDSTGTRKCAGGSRRRAFARMLSTLTCIVRSAGLTESWSSLDAASEMANGDLGGFFIIRPAMGEQEAEDYKPTRPRAATLTSLPSRTTTGSRKLAHPNGQR